MGRGLWLVMAVRHWEAACWVGVAGVLAFGMLWAQDFDYMDDMTGLAVLVTVGILLMAVGLQLRAQAVSQGRRRIARIVGVCMGAGALLPFFAEDGSPFAYDTLANYLFTMAFILLLLLWLLAVPTGLFVASFLGKPVDALAIASAALPLIAAEVLLFTEYGEVSAALFSVGMLFLAAGALRKPLQFIRIPAPVLGQEPASVPAPASSAD